MRAILRLPVPVLSSIVGVMKILNQQSPFSVMFRVEWVMPWELPAAEHKR